MKGLGKILLVVVLIVVMCGLRAEAIDGEYVYFTQDRNITNINTQLPAKKGLLKKEEFGVVATGNYLNVVKAPKESVKIRVEIRVSNGKKISFGYGVSPKDSFYRRIPLFQQLFAEDEANTHVYLIFPSWMVLTKEVQEISVVNADGEENLMMACSPENMRFYKILRKYNAAIEGGRDLSKSDKSEMERAFDNTVDKMGKVGFGIKVVKGVIKKGLEWAEKKRIERLQEKYGKDCQIYKMPFYSFEGTSFKYVNVGRLSIVYFDTSKLAGPAKVFIEVPQMMFGVTVPGAVRKASLEGLVYMIRFRGKRVVDTEAQRELNYALFWAALKYNLKKVKRLIENGADVDATWDGMTALIQASHNGHLDMVKYLVENGANVNAVDRFKETALMKASYTAHSDMVKYLVENGANVNAVDNKGETVLMKASIISEHIFVANHLLDMVKYLVENGAEINAVDNKGETALNYADEKGHTNVVEYFRKVQISKK